jgi:hypothetical protein
MTADIRDLLERQARWQKSRVVLPWSEKVRLAEAVRESILRLRGLREVKNSESCAAPEPTRR